MSKAEEAVRFLNSIYGDKLKFRSINVHLEKHAGMLR